eukprot:3664527-Karenia_brevis.AAC.1
MGRMQATQHNELLRHCRHNLLACLNVARVSFVHVKSHCNVYYNELADELANAGRAADEPLCIESCAKDEVEQGAQPGTDSAYFPVAGRETGRESPSDAQASSTNAPLHSGGSGSTCHVKHEMSENIESCQD